jgi:CXXC-20-CXXC protein
MKTRTCPYCNYEYSIAEYSQLFFKFGFTKFNCKNCNRKLTINFTQRIIVAIVFGCGYIALVSLKNMIRMTSFQWAVLLTTFILIQLFISPFDTFKKAD